MESRQSSLDWSPTEFMWARDRSSISLLCSAVTAIPQEKCKELSTDGRCLSNRSIPCFISAKLLFTPKAVVWMKGMTECTSSLYHSLQVFQLHQMPSLFICNKYNSFNSCGGFIFLYMTEFCYVQHHQVCKYFKCKYFKSKVSVYTYTLILYIYLSIYIYLFIYIYNAAI